MIVYFSSTYFKILYLTLTKITHVVFSVTLRVGRYITRGDYTPPPV